jgi:GDPmannose 4,6-dehydratase
MLTTVLVTGVGGQDGILLARHLRAHGHRVVGTLAPGTLGSAPTAVYLDGVELVEHDVRDTGGFQALLEQTRPVQVYNLAAFSSVGASFHHAELVEAVNTAAVEGMLRALLRHRARPGPAVRFFQASSSEMFAGSAAPPWREDTARAPLSPYGASKCAAHELVESYRDRHGLFACSGILFNHESQLRGPQFVTRKITRATAEIALRRRTSLTLGNLDVRRDWGAARDHVRAMASMLARDEPADYVIATGQSHSLGELLVVAFAAAGLGDPAPYVVQDPALMRPADVPETLGDATKAHEELGWQPTVGFEEMVGHMVAVDLERVTTGVEESPAYLDDRSQPA